MNSRLISPSSPSPKFALKNSTKEILRGSTSSVSTLSGKTRSPQNNLPKSPFLLKDNVNFSPGYGLWCHNLNENRNGILPNYRSEKGPNLETKFERLAVEPVSKIDQQIIDQLRFQVSDLVNKLEVTYGKYYEAEFKSKMAEDAKLKYYEITKAKITENQDLVENVKLLESHVEQFNVALANAKSDIGRLNKELENERVKYVSLHTNFEKYKRESEIKEEQLNNDNRILIEKIKEASNNENILSQEGLKPRQRLSRKSVGVYNSPNKKNTTTYDIEKDKSENLEMQMETHKSIKPSIFNDNSLKYQLEIVDLKKKISEDELQKNKLLQIIKSKKEKIKMFKTNFEKLVNLFDESSKENKYKENVVNKKNNMIQILKEKIKIKDDEGKKLLDDIKHLQKQKKITFETGVEVNNEELRPVKASSLFNDLLGNVISSKK